MQYNPLEDGITHLNLYSKANTELGRFCSNFIKCPIETEDGHFDSIEGYWSWLGISEKNPSREKFRMLYGVQAKTLKKELLDQGDPGRNEPHFKEKIRTAIHLKFQTEQAIRLMKQYQHLMRLPICHYYYYGNKDNAKVIDITETYPEFVCSVKQEFNAFLQKYQIHSVLDVTDGIICHQVNCQNVMGAGIAKAIYEKYPDVKRLYHKRCEMYSNQRERSAALYGHYQLVKVSDTLMVANIFSQDPFGNGPKRGVQFTNPEYLVGSLEKIAKQFPDKTVYVPEKIGCGFGGGNWYEISGMIEELNLPNIHIVESREIAWERGENKEDDGWVDIADALQDVLSESVFFDERY